MYYTVSEESGMIIDHGNECPDPQEAADFFSCAIYIIEGEHSGLSASPTVTPKSDAERIAELEAENAKLREQVRRGVLLF